MSFLKPIVASSLLLLAVAAQAPARTYRDAVRECNGRRFEIKQIDGRTYYSCTGFDGTGFICPASDRQ